jgi:hypothetical protein
MRDITINVGAKETLQVGDQRDATYDTNFLFRNRDLNDTELDHELW